MNKETAAQNTSRPPVWVIVILSVILLAGAAYRVGYVVQYSQHNSFTELHLDPEYHDYWARGIATGDWTLPEGTLDPEIRTNPYFRPPGYVFFLAGIYEVAGTGKLAPRVVQMALGLGSVLLGFAVGRRFFGDVAGLLVSAFLSSWWVFIFYEGELIAPAPTTFLLLMLLYLLSGWAVKNVGLWHGVLVGLVLGVMGLFVPNYFLLAAIIIPWVFWLRLREGKARMAIAPFIGIIISVIIVLAPVTLRNYRVSGEFVPISTNAGINLHFGLNDYADGHRPCSRRIPSWDCFHYPSIVRTFSEYEGEDFTHNEVSSQFTEMAIDYVKENPKAVRDLVWKKAVLFWGPREISNEKQVELYKDEFTALRLAPGGFAWVFALSLAGLGLYIVRWRTRPETVRNTQMHAVAVLAFATVIVIFATYLPFFAASKFRVPLLPLVWLFGAFFFVELVRLARDRKYLVVVLGIAFASVFYLIASKNYYGWEPQYVQFYFEKAENYRVHGECDKAIKWYRKGTEIEYSNWDLQLGLARCLEATGDHEGAVDKYYLLMELFPPYFEPDNEKPAAVDVRKGFARSLMNYADQLDKRGKVERADALREFARTRGVTVENDHKER